MRFADRPTTEVDVFVAAPPKKVWPLVSEILTPSRFGTELQQADLGRARGGALPRRPLHRPQLPRCPGRVGDDQTITDCVPE